MATAEEAKRTYYEAHKEERRAYQKQYREKHKAEQRDYQKKYREQHKDHLKDLNREWHAENRDHVRAKKKQARLENPGAYRAQHKADKQRRRARQKEGGSYTGTQLQECLKFFGHCCAYSGEPLEPDYHVDHVVALSQGGSNTINNIVPSNREPNLAKSDKDMETWFRSSSYFSEERLEKIKQWTTNTPGVG